MTERFNPEGSCCIGMEDHVVMKATEDGNFVSYDDYELLLEKYQNLCKKISELYWET